MFLCNHLTEAECLERGLFAGTRFDMIVYVCERVCLYTQARARAYLCIWWDGAGSVQ